MVVPWPRRLLQLGPLFATAQNFLLRLQKHRVTMQFNQEITVLPIQLQEDPMKTLNNELAKSVTSFNQACDQWTELLQNCQDMMFAKCHQGFENYQEMVRFSLDNNERFFSAIKETTLQNRELMLNALRSSICEVNNVC